MPKVTVVIPMCNSEKYLERCLESVLSQSISDIEVICVDNDSIDSSCDIVEKYIIKDNRLKLIKSHNRGPGGARNLGIENSKSEYVGFLDSDDWIDEKYYEKLYETAKRFDADVACCGLIREHKNRRKYRAKFKKEDVYTDVQEKLKVCKVPEMCYSVNKIYRISKLNDVNLRYPEKVFFEDVPFSFKVLFYLEKLVTVPEVFYHYFDNPTSIVKTSGEQKAIDKQNAYKEVREFARANNIKLSEEDMVAKTSYVKFLKIPIIKSKHFDECVKHYLFGIIYVGKS